MGRIGSHLALLAKAFGMKVIGIRRDPSQGENGADSIYGMGDLLKLVAAGRHRGADVQRSRPNHGPDEQGGTFAAMKPSSVLRDVSRGKVADEGPRSTP